MAPDLTPAVLLALGVVGSVAVTWLIGRRLAAQAEAAAVAADAETAAVPTADAVVCARCGAENDRRYRYCRACVAELPRGRGGSATAGAPFGREID